MTREEAINHIKYGIIENNYPLPKELGIEACKMAIKALQQEPILDKIRAEIRELKHFPANSEDKLFYNAGLLDAIEIIDKYKAESEDKE